VFFLAAAVLGGMSERNTPVPVEEDDEYVVDIEDIGEEGDGVAYVDDFVVLVPGGEMGDRARVRIERVESEFAMAEVLDHESDVT
jgi:predicted RNA-binding protein with TRAM domain